MNELLQKLYAQTRVYDEHLLVRLKTFKSQIRNLTLYPESERNIDKAKRKREDLLYKVYATQRLWKSVQNIVYTISRYITFLESLDDRMSSLVLRKSPVRGYNLDNILSSDYIPLTKQNLDKLAMAFRRRRGASLLSSKQPVQSSTTKFSSLLYAMRFKYTAQVLALKSQENNYKTQLKEVIIAIEKRRRAVEL